MKSIYLIYSLPISGTLSGELTGGLQSVIAEALVTRKVSQPSYHLVIISPDEHSFGLATYGAEVRSANSGNLDWTGLYDIWFDECWAYLHPDAYSLEYVPRPILETLFRGSYTTPIGTVERIIEHFSKYGPLTCRPQASQGFTEGFVKEVRNIPRDSTVFWHDYFFAETMLATADDIRDKGCRQVFYLHTTLPAELHMFSWGRKLLGAMSKMDVVRVHTDLYGKNLATQLSALGLPLPSIERFDLGVDCKLLEEGVVAVTPETYAGFPEYRNASAEQKALVDEIFRSRGSVPYRFMNIDRADPLKGQVTVVEAIDRYLEECQRGGVSIDDHRFFLVWPFKNIQTDNPFHLHWQYNAYLKKVSDALVEKYPGVVYVCDGIPRSFIPAALVDATAITGGIQDGLNLSVQEGIYVNAIMKKDVGAIVGQGAGFAIQYAKSRPDIAYFVKQGSTEEMTKAIRDIVRNRHVNPSALKEMVRAAGEVVKSRDFDVMQE